MLRKQHALPGTVYLIPLSLVEQVSGKVIALLGLLPWLFGLQGAPDALFQRRDERIGSERPVLP